MLYGDASTSVQVSKTMLIKHFNIINIHSKNLLTREKRINEHKHNTRCMCMRITDVAYLAIQWCLDRIVISFFGCFDTKRVTIETKNVCELFL